MFLNQSGWSIQSIATAYQLSWKFMSVRYNQIGYVCIFKFEITSDFNCGFFSLFIK